MELKSFVIVRSSRVEGDGPPMSSSRAVRVCTRGMVSSLLLVLAHCGVVPDEPGSGAPRGDDGGLASSSENEGGGELCSVAGDEDGDGSIDEGCSCATGSVRDCFPGSAEQRNVGICRDGVQRCEGTGEFGGTWGSCEGAVTAEPEVPSNNIDEDCDGVLGCAEAELACDDERDEDCDGLSDCDDPDCAGFCRAPVATGEICGNGVDDNRDGAVDCDDVLCEEEPRCAFTPRQCAVRCIPGTERFCHVEDACTWGVQRCGSDNRWTVCEETARVPPACQDPDEIDPDFGLLPGDLLYDADCCVAIGACCDNQREDYTLVDPSLPTHAMVGNCATQALCGPE